MGQRQGHTCRTSSFSWTMAVGLMTSFTSSWRSRATGARTRKRGNPRWTTYWIPGVNNLGTFGRWAFAELREVYEIESDLEGKIRQAFEEAIPAIPSARVQAA